MKLLMNVLNEVLSLFVDDGSLVVAVIAWTGLSELCLRVGMLSPTQAAVLLAIGIAALLGENVMRAARKHANAPAGGR